MKTSNCLKNTSNAIQLGTNKRNDKPIFVEKDLRHCASTAHVVEKLAIEAYAQRRGQPWQLWRRCRRNLCVPSVLIGVACYVVQRSCARTEANSPRVMHLGLPGGNQKVVSQKATRVARQTCEQKRRMRASNVEDAPSIVAIVRSMRDLATVTQPRKINGWNVEFGSHGYHRYQRCHRRKYHDAPNEGSRGDKGAAHLKGSWRHVGSERGEGFPESEPKMQPVRCRTSRE